MSSNQGHGPGTQAQGGKVAKCSRAWRSSPAMHTCPRERGVHTLKIKNTFKCVYKCREQSGKTDKTT